MKRSIFLNMFMMISCLALQAQGIYFGGSVGYGIQDKTNKTAHNFNGRHDISKGNFGTGPVANIAVGYFFNDIMAVELVGGCYSGVEKNKTMTEADSFGAEGFSKPRAKGFYLNPTFVVRSDDFGVCPYVKAGLFIGLSTKATYEDNYRYHILGSSDLYVNDRTSYTGKVNYGGTVNIGLDFMLTDKFALYGEFFARLVFWRPAWYYEEISATKDGSTVLLPKEYDSNFRSLSLCSGGLNVGVRYYLFDF